MEESPPVPFNERQQQVAAEAAELAEVGGVSELPPDEPEDDRSRLTQPASITDGPVTLPPNLKVNLGACAKQAWACFRHQPWMAILATLVYAALIACGALAGQFILGYALVYVEIENPQTYWALFWNGFLECLARFPVFFFIPPMRVAYFQAVQDYRKRGHIDFISFFSGFRWFFHLLVLELVIDLTVALGIVALLIPGLAAILFFKFAPILFVAFPQLGLWHSFRLAVKQSIRYWVTVLTMLLLNLAILIAGAACLGVGVLVAIPVTSYLEAFVFSEIFVATPGQPGVALSPSSVAAPVATAV